MVYKFIKISIFLLLFFSCKTNKNKSEPVLCNFYNGNIEIIDKYKNGSIKGQYFINENSSVQGIFRSYHENGKLNAIGCYLENYRIGKFYFYDNSGNLNRTVEYIPIADTNISVPNKIIYYKNSVPIYNSPSCFFINNFSSDTINFGDSNILNIKTFGYKKKHKLITFCKDYNQFFDVRNKNYDSCYAYILRGDEINIKFHNYSYSLGMNIIRMEIVNFDSMDDYGKVYKSATTYLVDSFFVR